jgi:hypothetical protein
MAARTPVWVLIAVTVAPTTSPAVGSVTIPEILPVMLAHTSAELTKNPSTATVAKRMIRRVRIVVTPEDKLDYRNFLENAR